VLFVVKPNLKAVFFKCFMINFISLPTYATFGRLVFGVRIFNPFCIAVSLFKSELSYLLLYNIFYCVIFFFLVHRTQVICFHSIS
jgi:hypothetical protein